MAIKIVFQYKFKSSYCTIDILNLPNFLQKSKNFEITKILSIILNEVCDASTLGQAPVDV